MAHYMIINSSFMFCSVNVMMFTIDSLKKVGQIIITYVWSDPLYTRFWLGDFCIVQRDIQGYTSLFPDRPIDPYKSEFKQLIDIHWLVFCTSGNWQSIS